MLPPYTHRLVLSNSLPLETSQKIQLFLPLRFTRPEHQIKILFLFRYVN